MSAALRLVDTGLGDARWNVALTAALAELHGAGRIPDTLRSRRDSTPVRISGHE